MTPSQPRPAQTGTRRPLPPVLTGTLRPIARQRPDLPTYTVDADDYLPNHPPPLLFVAEHIARLTERPLTGPCFDLQQSWAKTLPGPAAGISDFLIASYFLAGGDFCAISSLGIYQATDDNAVTCLRIRRFLDLREDFLFGRDVTFPQEDHLLLGLFCSLSASVVRLQAAAYSQGARN